MRWILPVLWEQQGFANLPPATQGFCSSGEKFLEGWGFPRFQQWQPRPSCRPSLPRESPRGLQLRPVCVRPLYLYNKQITTHLVV